METLIIIYLVFAASSMAIPVPCFHYRSKRKTTGKLINIKQNIAIEKDLAKHTLAVGTDLGSYSENSFEIDKSKSL